METHYKTVNHRLFYPVSVAVIVGGTTGNVLELASEEWETEGSSRLFYRYATKEWVIQRA